MSYDAFKKAVICNLATYKNKVLGIEENGIYKYKGKDIPKGHILPIFQGKNKEYIVREYNVLSCMKGKDFLIEKDLHRYAHHLNSSQLMCYNFFRPFIEGEVCKTRPNKSIIDLLKNYIIDINPCNDSECQFEYVQDGEYEGEGTNFDFYLRSGEIEVFFEIKYTEAGFGKCENDEKHRNKYEKIYKGLIDKCPAIKGNIKYDGEFRKNYQLFRNSIRATDKNKYVIFIYDKNNQYCKTQLNYFLEKYIAADYKKNIIGITWEDLVKKMESPHKCEFYNKYLGYSLK